MKSKRPARPGMALPASQQRFEMRPVRHALMRTMLMLATVTVLMIGNVAAQVPLYDNLDAPGGNGNFIGPFFQPGDRFAAQPFFTSEYEAISSVTVKLQRRGNSSGPLELEIWNDADGRPGEIVDTFGTVDLADIDADDADLVPFNGLVTGLDANSTYYVVLDSVDALIPNDNNSYHIGMTNLNEGTNDAPRLQVSLGRNHDRWAELGSLLPGANFLQMSVTAVPPVGQSSSLFAGDADQDLDFDQMDLVQVQVAAKYLTGQPATWGEGDWDARPGGTAGNPPLGNGIFDQLDVIAALGAGTYLTGPYAAIAKGGTAGDGQASVIYDTSNGELSVDAPVGVELTSINIDSAGGIFTGSAAENLGGSFDNDADKNIFKATFGNSFGSVSFGNVAQPALSEEFVLTDLTVLGSLAGGGDLGNVDLVYVPEPTAVLLLSVGLVFGLLHSRRANP